MSAVRRIGPGDAEILVQAVAGWAAVSRGTELRLWVTDERAATFDRESGFVEDGRRQPLPHAPEVAERGMMRLLAREAQPPPAPPGALSL